MDLREIVGNLPLVVVGASTVLLNPQNEVLLIERSDNGLWGLPAGSTELNESPAETAVREIAEETGLLVKESALRLINVFGGADYAYTYPNGDHCSLIVVSYLVRDYGGQLLTQTDETLNAKFFSFSDLPNSDLPKPIAQHEQLILEYYAATVLRTTE